MSCKTPFPEELWQIFQHDIAHRRCPECTKGPLVGGESPIVFGVALISTWRCQHCGEEVAYVVTPEGEVYRT